MRRIGDRLASSYRLRITLGFVAVIALLAAAWLGSLFGPLTSAVTRQQEEQLTRVARAGALALESAEADPAEVAVRLGDRGMRVTLVDRDGLVLADNQNDAGAMENHRGRPEIAAALDGRTGRDVRRSRTEGVEQLYVAVPARLGGRPVALRVSETLTSVSTLAAAARGTGLLVLLAAVGVSLFVTWRLSSIAAAPVTRLADAAGAVARGDLDFPVPREAGELGALSSALEDLALQVRSRIAQAEAERENLRAVLDGLDDAVLLLEGDTVRIANGAASRLFKPPHGGWAGRTLQSATLPASLVAAIQDASVSGTSHSAEVGPDPTGRTLRLFVTPIEAPRGTLVVLSDVTERTRLDAMRRDFVANASHELKTPASAIQLLAETAETAAADGDVDQALTFVRQMRSEAARLRALVLDLLDLSRLEQVGRGERITDVRHAVDLALAGHRSAAEARGLALEADFSAVEGQDVFVAADPTDVAIALDNLLSNAIAYTEQGGVRVAVGAEDDRVRLVVTDTGIGIPAEALPRVFERFFRVDRARGRDSGGTGLGLALVRHVAERNDGEVSVASEVGAGSTFTLLLPRAT